MNGCLSGRVLTSPCGQYLSKDDLIHCIGGQTISRQQASDDSFTESMGRDTGQSALEAADRCACRIDNDNLPHTIPSRHNCISGTYSGTIKRPAVLLTISSTLTPGARSFRTKAPSAISR